ncbi:type VII secretion protein EccCa [Cumulibacter manganitolerans]|uniref:type VII secretion protein EccCa n=1 Tax=Cumulibacter manganitolerans TaxID=1884992 RepID=UPI0012967440|nr:type VII secretion protein EccCa [Cumulibacter manganitolerans]
MGTFIVRRQPRREAPELPAGEVVIDPPPEVPRDSGKNWSQLMMMLPMLAGAGAMALMYSRNGSSGPMGYVLGGLFGLSAIGMIGVGLLQNAGGASKRERTAQRREYLRHLASHRSNVKKTIRRQATAMFYRHPEPDQLLVTAASYRLWERRRDDADFGAVRIGLGPQQLATPLITPQTKPLDELEPVCAAALRRFVNTYANVPGLPVAMALGGFSRVYLTGDASAARSMLRALLAQTAVHHSPDDMMVAICAGPAERAHWEWVKWLPHGFHPEREDAAGNLRLVAPNMPSIEAMLDDVLSTRPRFNPAGPQVQVPGPHLVVVVDGGDVAGSSHLMADSGLEGVTVIDLSSPPPRLLESSMLVLDVAEDRALRSRTDDVESALGIADSLALPEVEALARQLAPLRMSIGAVGEKAMSTAMGLGELLDVGDPYRYDPGRGWGPRANRDQLRVPIGIGPDGRPVELDIKESAQDGMGPHGLLIGATGSGKSELLRTLVLALAITHSPETLNFVLVDFKGGATFTKLERLPHTSAVITNLSDELPLVDRMVDAINGELLRRQELLRTAGKFSSLRDYEKARLAGAPLDPMPSLLIVCDEFSELLSAKPDFIDMFVQIGRVGRSLGVHLLLASQRLEEGRLRGLDTHLSYRVSLRTNSASESRVVIGAPDAFELPRAPGHGYIKFGTDPLERFRAAYVSGMYKRKKDGGSAGDPRTDGVSILPYDTLYHAPPIEVKPADDAVAADPDEGVGESLLDIVVDRLEGRGPEAHQVWLPPLAEPPTLDQLLPGLSVDPELGLTAAGSELRGTLKANVGVIDKPFEQRRETMQIDLSGAGGHLMVVGAPQSGKSTFLRSVVCGLALTHSPREVQFYCFDFGGGGLGALRDLPHVGSVAGRRDTNAVRRTIAELSQLLEQRETLFAQHGIENMAAYRRAKARGELPDDPYGDVFLVVDGWQTIRNDFEPIEPVLNDLGTRGLSYGIHLIGSASRWMDLRLALRDMFGTKYELRLGDPGDSVLGRRVAMNVPDDKPGRGLTPDLLHMLTAIPRIDGVQDVESLPDGVADLVARIRDAWPRPGAPAVRLLPREVRHDQVRPDRDRGLALGISELDLGPVYLDADSEPLMVVYGDSESGKSNLLRVLAHRIMERYSPDQAKIIIVDPRRSLLGEVPPSYLLAYGTTPDHAAAMSVQLAKTLRNRLPGSDVTPEQLRNRSWWTGPELFFLVDDVDLAAAGSPPPLQPLVDFMAQARDIGLHLTVTRRSGGAGRAQYEALLQRMRDLAAPGIVLSGSRDEGALVGTVRPQVLPPGRGYYVTRREGTRLVQIAWKPPADL